MALPGWKREFDQFVTNGNLPSLSLVRLSHDHMGNFGTALGGVNTPETQQADCDLAVGLLVQAVANSPYGDTLIIITEDDCRRSRPRGFTSRDHLRRRSLCEAGRRHQHPYSQVNALRTIEDILGTEHINLNTAFQRPMTEVFDIRSSGDWTYGQGVDGAATTEVAAADGHGLRFAAGPVIKPKHDATSWDTVTAGFSFSEPDQVPPAQFNRVLWTGLMGHKTVPGHPRRARWRQAERRLTSMPARRG